VSTFNKIDVSCGECGEEFTGILWTAVHAGEDPVLKDILLGGELNILMCPKCSHAAYRDHFVLYQDPAAELIAYIYPPDQASDEAFLRQSMLLAFHEAQKVMDPKERKDYVPILVFGLATFVEMMREETIRAEQSQIAEAICRESSIPYTVLRPSKARAFKSVRVLPCGTSREQPTRADILGGLDRLLVKNPALNIYAGLHKAIQENHQWHFPIS
jgi:hypothetical protein